MKYLLNLSLNTTFCILTEPLRILNSLFTFFLALTHLSIFCMYIAYRHFALYRLLRNLYIKTILHRYSRF